MISNSLRELDRAHLIHPVSSFRGHESRGARILTSATGMFVRDSENHELIDAFSGLWCVNAGYGQQSVIDAATRQLETLPYATGYFGFSNEPAIRLAAQLSDLAPEGLDHVFFTLGGSDAVDSALRYITYYYNATGRPTKKQCIALKLGYHGSSSNGAGLTALPSFHRNFDVPRSWQHHIESPYPYRNDCNDATLIARSVAELRAKVEALGQENVAAFFCEPVQGSGGVIVPPRGWLKAMRAACDELDILMVVDEVITGFGRTGPMFACETEGISPDLMTMAKGLTSGYAPMGAVMLSRKVYDGIADGSDSSLAIGHGLTYSAHPVSAAVGLEVLRLYTEGGILAHAQSITPAFHTAIDGLETHPLVGQVRHAGLLAGIELVADKTSKAKFAPSLRIGERLFDIAYENGLIVRAFPDGVIGLAPALIMSEDEAKLIAERINVSLDQLLREPDIRAACRS